jgi:hypothetical protein
MVVPDTRRRVAIAAQYAVQLQAVACDESQGLQREVLLQVWMRRAMDRRCGMT